MDGFDHVDLQQPDLFGRVFGRKPKENALREIQNLLADRAVHDLTAADVENILSNYELPRPAAAERLRGLYRTALELRVKGFHVSDGEIAELRQLRYVLGLKDADSKEVEADFLRDKYREVLSDEEKRRFDALVAREVVVSAFFKEKAETLFRRPSTAPSPTSE